jgi:cytochrome c556
MRYSRPVISCVALILLSAVVAVAALNAQEGKLPAFMRSKLFHSEKTLEGLATEDFTLIAKHSQAISLLCEDELWSVLRTKEYQDRSDEFRRSVDAITKAAREKDLDAATLAYVDTTMKCVSCHKYVRKEKAKQ